MSTTFQWALWAAGMACFLAAAVLKLGIPGGLVVLGFALVRVSGVLPDATNLGSVISVIGAVARSAAAKAAPAPEVKP